MITGPSGAILTLEGVRVPVTSIKVSCGVLRPATAAISVPYSVETANLLPRTLVHVWIPDPSIVTTAEPDEGSIYGTDSVGPFAVRQKDPDDPRNYILLFAGEVHSWGESRNAGRRECQLMCKDFTDYWDNAPLYFGFGGATNRSFQRAMFMGGSNLSEGGKRVKGASSLIRIMRAAPRTVPTLQGVLGGVVNLLESVTGVYDPKAGKVVRGVNDFLSQAELRLHLTRQLGISPHDTSSKILLGGASFSRYIRQVAMSLRHTSSFGQLLRVFLVRTFHQYSSVAAPPYIPEGAKATYLLKVRNSGMSSTARGVEKELDDAIRRLTNALDARKSETDSRTGRDLVDNFQLENSSGKNAPDTGAQKAWKKKYSSGKEAIPTPSEVQRIRNKVEALSTDYQPNPVLGQKPKSSSKKQISYGNKRILRDRVNHLDRAAAIANENLMGEITVPVIEESVLPGHTRRNFLATYEELEAAAAKTKSTYRTVTRGLELNDRLHTTLFSPNIWMCPPPACNVIFPDQYSTLSFGRTPTAEVTRLWLHGLFNSGKENYAQSYFAPNVDILGINVNQIDLGKAATKAMSYIMPHEVFSGVVPVIEGLGDGLYLNKLNRQVEKVEGDKPGITKTSKLSSLMVKSPALMRAANAKYLEYKFSGRQASLAGPLNVRVVPGLPALVIDEGQSPYARSNPRHLLGYVVSIEHSITQGGSNTSIQMSHCRYHDEGLEDFGETDPTDATVTMVKKITPNSSKLKHGGKLYAEVYGWRKKVEYTGSGKNRKKKIIDEPIVGMLGTQSDTGLHVTGGLFIQDAAVPAPKLAKNTRNFSDFVTSGVPYSESPLDEPLVAYKITPVRNKNLSDNLGDQGGAKKAPGDLSATGAFFTGLTAGNTVNNDILRHNGYEYTKKFPWMSERAVGAVVVEARPAWVRLGRSHRKFQFTFEEIARPPWLSSIYLNQNIGPQFYLPLIGCGSIVDPTAVAQVGGVGTDAEVANTALQNRLRLAQLDVKSSQIAQGSDRVVVSVQLDDGRIVEVPATSLGGMPIQLVADRIGKVYWDVTDSGDPTDVGAFIELFTRRKFANMVEIFGPDVTVEGLPEFRDLPDITGRKAGFHELAVGPFEDLAGLPRAGLTNIPSTFSKNQRKIDPRVDPRRRRLVRVRRLADDLHRSGGK